MNMSNLTGLTNFPPSKQQHRSDYIYELVDKEIKTLTRVI